MLHDSIAAFETEHRRQRQRESLVKRTLFIGSAVVFLAASSMAPAQVTVTAEIKGRRFHGSHRSTDVIEASIRAYLKACCAIGESGIMDGRGDFYVHGEFLWE